MYGDFIGSIAIYRLNKEIKQLEEWPDAPSLTLGILKIGQKVTTTDNQLFYGVTVNSETVYLPEESLTLLGSYELINQYASVTKKATPIFGDATLSAQIGTTDSNYQKTYRLTEKLTSVDGTSYYLLFDNQKNKIG